MKISKVIVVDDNGNETEFKVTEGTGIFILEDKKQLVMSSKNEIINMLALKNCLGVKEE